MPRCRFIVPPLVVIGLTMLTVPARTETLELSCTMPPPDPPMHISIDLASATARDFCPPCSSPYPIRITEQAFFLGGGKIVIDRMTGHITWATGATGTCTRLTQPKF